MYAEKRSNGKREGSSAHLIAVQFPFSMRVAQSQT
jgi:hypothetical protein